jgi:hypothetical protein
MLVTLLKTEAILDGMKEIIYPERPQRMVSNT